MQNVELCGRVFFSKSGKSQYGPWVTIGVDVGQNAGIFISINKPTDGQADLKKGDYILAANCKIKAQKKGDDKPLENQFSCKGRISLFSKRYYHY